MKNMIAIDAASSSLGLSGWGPAAFIVVATVGLLLWQKVRIKMDPREPPLVRPWIPLVGHLIGMLRYHQRYFEELSLRFPVPAYTLPVFTSKMYVIASPELQQAAFRAQNLDFDPFIVEFGVRLVDCDPEAGKIFKHVPEDPREMSFLKGFHKALHAHMTPGPNVQRMNANMLKTMAREMNGIQDEQKDSLYLWLRNIFTEATASAMFGSNNPWARDRSLIDSFWEFEKDVFLLLAGLMPSVLAPKAFKARIDNQTALQEYFAAGYNEDPDVSGYARARAELLRNSGFSKADVGRFEIANIHVSVANATPSFFWLMLFIASDPQLTEDIRAELSKVVSASDHGGKREMTINITSISEACPLLHSAFQETLRLTDRQAATRIVKEDFILADSKDSSSSSSSSSYLLRKGATVQIPGGIPHPLHGDLGPRRCGLQPSTVPEDRTGFRERGDARGRQGTGRSAAGGAFVPFGGGVHLCPGRHFASAEILGSAAVMVVMGYDITTAGDGATLPRPMLEEWESIQFGEAVAKPVGRLKSVGARVRRRQGFEDVLWKFETGWGSE